MADLMKQYRELNEKLFGLVKYYEDMTASLEQDLDDLSADFEECNLRKCEVEAAFHQAVEDSDKRCEDLYHTARDQAATISRQAKRIHNMVRFIKTHREELEAAMVPDDYEEAVALFDLDDEITLPED